MRTPPANPWLPYRGDISAASKAEREEYAVDCMAIQLLMQGTCPEHLQKRAVEVIVHKLCGTYDLSFRPGEDGDRATTFAEGKRFVGLQLVTMSKTNTAALTRPEVNPPVKRR